MPLIIPEANFSMPSAVVGGAARRNRLELHAVRPVVDPPAARLHELAGADGRSVADDGDQVALAAGLHPQHEAAVPVEGDRSTRPARFSRSLTG